MEIKYYNREKGCVEIEKVYGDAVMKSLYQTFWGKLLLKFITMAPVSILYGMTQSFGISRQKIPDFIKKFNIQMEDYRPEVDAPGYNGYSSFNSFFIRRFRAGARTIDSRASHMPAFCEARYFGFSEITDSLTFPIKGKYYGATDFLANEKWSEVFKGGPLMIARLCPVDYHRFHFPDKGNVLEHYKVNGPYHSVNPLAIDVKKNILSTNVREVTILETENFGKIAYIEVGAVCVGKIVQSYVGGDFSRGDEKGYFLFGGSTVVVLGEKGRWLPSEDILKNTKEGMETYIKLGDEVAKGEIAL